MLILLLSFTHTKHLLYQVRLSINCKSQHQYCEAGNKALKSASGGSKEANAAFAENSIYHLNEIKQFVGCRQFYFANSIFYIQPPAALVFLNIKTCQL